MKRQLVIPVLCSLLLAACDSDNSTPSGTNTNNGNQSGENTNSTDGDDGTNSGNGTDGGNGTNSDDSTDNGNGTDSGTDIDSDNGIDTGNGIDSGTNTDNGNGTDSGTDTDGGDNSESSPPSGFLNTAQPVFSWPAVANAEQYKIVVKDAGGSGYSRSLDPVTANCQTGEGTCSATTSVAYYDNNLNWFVESTVNGAPGPVSATNSITTPLSENMQPILSNTNDECEAWASVAYDKYVVLNNAWNADVMANDSWSQIINVTENANGTVTPAWSYDWLGQFDTNSEFGEYEVKAYPEVLYGPKLGTHVSGTKEETGLPEQVKNLPEFVVTYDFSETLDENAERNVALESFFHDSESIQGPCDDVDNRAYEMMIWVNNPTIRTPGDLALTGVMVDNQLWNVYIKPRTNKHYIAFTAQNPSTSGTLNWKRFVDWTKDWTATNAAERQIDVLNPEFYMGAIEIGTEMWWGSGTFTLNKFEVSF